MNAFNSGPDDRNLDKWLTAFISRKYLKRSVNVSRSIRLYLKIYWNTNQRPKIEDYNDYLYIVLENALLQ